MTGPLAFVDTSNNYGIGRAETRIGQAIRELGGLPEGVVLARRTEARCGQPPCSPRSATPRVTSTIVGLSEPSRVAETVELAALRLPDALWASRAALTVGSDLWLH
jgi:aryl-alcohol dehydrogenase-like predicted oxidoreductase